MIKTTIRIATGLVFLALILWGSSHFIKPKTGTLTDNAGNPCALDVTSTMLPDPEHTLKTDRQIVQAVFDHYFSFYKNNPQCLASSIESARLVSVDNIKHLRQDVMLADITFDLQPTSMEKNQWMTSEVSTATPGWVRNKKGTLSIQTASSTYYLVL